MPRLFATLCLFGLPLLACRSASPDAARAPRTEGTLTLEAIFKTDDFVPKLPTGHLWMPDGESMLYRTTEGGETKLIHAPLGSAPVRPPVDWSAVLDGLEQERLEYEAPAMNDVNRTGRFSFPPILDPTGQRLAGTHRGDLFLFELESSAARYVTQGPRPELFFDFSPDGTQLAFVRAGELFRIDLADGQEFQLTHSSPGAPLLSGIADWAYEEEFGVRRSFWWSPDSRHIAYLQYDPSPIPKFPITDELEAVPALERQRYPKAGSPNSVVRLGVLSLESGETRWLDTGEQDAYLPAAGWSSAERLWYQWLNRDQNHLELRFHDLTGDRTTTVLEERASDWVNLGDDPHFLGDGSFLWTAERDGWRHIYHHEASGALRRRLTRGDWQVETVYGTNEEFVFYQGTEEDPRERHIYRTPLAGGAATRLTEEAGTHRGSLSPDGRHLLDTYSSCSTPPVLLLGGTNGGHRVRSPSRMQALAAVDLAPVEFGQLAAEDGTPLYTALIKPPNFDPERRYPTLIYVYGGPHAQTVRRSWGGKRHLFFQYLAQQGYLVFWLDNRGSAGRGKAFEAAVHRRLGEVELADQLVGVRYLKSLSFVDPERIGVYGGSYGGTMTLNCMLRAPEHFRAGVAWAPVTDWRHYDSIYTERYMETPAANPEGYGRTAPLRYAAELRGELFLAHGLMDNNVHFQNSVQLIDALVKAEKSFELQIYPRTRHGSGAASYHFYRAMADFLFRKL